MRSLLIGLALCPLLTAQEHAARQWRTIALPPQALSLVLPSAWKPIQGPSQPLRVSEPPLALELRGPFTKQQAEAVWKAGRDGLAAWARGGLHSRDWAVPGGSGSRLTAASAPGRWAACGLVARGAGAAHVVSISVAAERPLLIHDARRVLDSIDARPFEQADRHVDWILGCSLEVPAGWSVRAAGAADLHPALPAGAFRGGLVVRPDEAGTFVVLRPLSSAASRRSAGEIAGLLGARPGGGRIRVRSRTVTLEDGASGTWREARSGEEGRSPLALSLVTERFELVVRVDRTRPGDEKAARRVLLSFRGDPWAGPRTDEPGRRGFTSPRAPGVTFLAPAGWTVEKPASGMRLLQLEPGGARATRCVAWFFGKGGGGGVQANFERWRGQVEGDTAPLRETHDIVTGVRAHYLDTRGTWVAETRPGSGEREQRPGWRLVGVVLEVPGGPLYVKLFGPQQEVERALPAFHSFIASFRPATHR